VSSHEIELSVNGERHRLAIEARVSLADAIREHIGLTGTHLGCEHGVCGACTVLIDDAPARACIVLAVQADGCEITTIEGVGEVDRLHVVQQAFRDTHGFQCGFCTPGLVIEAIALLRELPRPTEREVREAISGNICRCTGYESIVRGVLLAAERLEGQV
jgi:carbon-monoxide dehydrogenase small subunit